MTHNFVSPSDQLNNVLYIGGGGGGGRGYKGLPPTTHPVLNW